MRRVGVDIGGTFTDLIFVDDATGDIQVHKVPTSTDNPAVASIAGIEEVIGDLKPADLDYIGHGTTVATNAILTHTGAEVGLITTEGFRDILHMGRHKKPLNFSFYQDIPWHQYPIVRRKNRLTACERIIPPDGAIHVPLDTEQVARAVKIFKERRIDAISVCFLFSFLNPEHERQAAEIVRELYPEVFLSVRSEVMAQHREYESFSTVCLNAFVGPVVSRYVRSFDQALSNGGETKIHYMTASGGVATTEAAIHRPVTLVTSGPVAGLIGGVFSGRVAGFEDVITLDAGGTSADVGVCVAGELRRRHLLQTMIGGYALAIPMIDLDTIGAGGGSIASVDEGGVFRVGPGSAGAEPGPACYGRGGEEPTVTDAQLLLGRLRPETLLAGVLPLNRKLAEKAVAERIAAALGLTVQEAAAGIVRISTQLMTQAVESNSVRRGYDPRDFALVAMGGAGPMFALDIAHEMGIPWVVVPPHPGIGAALGLLATDVSYEEAQTVMVWLDDEGIAAAAAAHDDLSARMKRRLELDGFGPDQIRMDLFVDCRYMHQGYELTVPVPSYAEPGWTASAREAFDAAHEREYGRASREFDVQLVSVRVRASGQTARLRLPELPAGGEENPERALVGTADVIHLQPGPRSLPTAVFRRDQLRAGDRIIGPALLEQIDATTIISSGAEADVRSDGTLVIDCRMLGAPS